MLTVTQRQVLRAINDHCEIHGTLLLDRTSRPLPDLLANLGLPGAEVYTAVADLYELGLINGVMAGGAPYPVRIDGLTTMGRQELP